MKLMFIHGGTKLKEDASGNLYTDGNFNNKIWDRYRVFCDDLQVLLRKEAKIYDKDYAINKFNKLDKDRVECIPMPEIYAPVKNYFNFGIRRKVKSIIENSIEQCDYVIVRSASNYYCIQAIKIAKKYNKPYLVEVTGIAFHANWYHSIKGKLVAFYSEMCVKHYVGQAPYAIYVTNEVLQKRYPCKGRTLGCSDVELTYVNEQVLEDRLNRIENEKTKIIIGTAAFLNVKWKGQEYVIRALAKLKKMGIDNIEYQLIGVGDKTYLQNIANKYKVLDCVKILGGKPHDEVFEWLDSIDIYIQPSFQEGLCRALVEAMSRACPIICSNVGGNKELANKELLFKKGNVNDIVKTINKIIDKNLQRQEVVRSFEKAKEYKKEILDKKRNDFYLEFIKRK